MYLKQIQISRYRCFDYFSWEPSLGVNCLVGPGDAGKSTLLSAIGLLLAPYPVQQASEFDYFKRRVDKGFCIQAYVGGFDPAVIATSDRIPSLCGWANGKAVPLPDENGAEPVLHCSVRGTEGLEVVHELLIEGDEARQFSVTLRQKLLLTRVAGEERASRDLRLGTGTLLHRYLGASKIRRTINEAIGLASNNLEMPEEVGKNLDALGTRFGAEGLPTNLHLGLFPQQGSATMGMVALFAGDKSEEAIPLSYSGMGTKQLAVLSLSTAGLKESPIICIDEPERGLEPYRQRVLAKQLLTAVKPNGQAFMTTHSPAILGCLRGGSIWRLQSSSSSPVELRSNLLRNMIEKNPEALLAPTSVFCEGVTEVGLLSALLPEILKSDLDASGIRLVDGGGQPQIFECIRAFHDAGLMCAGFVDNEDKHKGTRVAMESKCVLFVWNTVKNIEEAVGRHLPLERFQDLLALAGGRFVRAKEDNVRSFLSLAPSTPRESFDELCASCGEQRIRDAMIRAMTECEWFKTEALGFELGTKLILWGLPPFIRENVQGFAKRLPRLTPE